MGYDLSVQMGTQPANAYDTGVKYGGVGSAIGGVASKWIANQDALDKQKKVDLIMTQYNNPNNTAFAGLTPAQKDAKMAKLMYPLDANLSAKYETSAANFRNQEDARNQLAAKNAPIAAAFAKPEKDQQDKQDKFLADQVTWKENATTKQGMLDELAKAEDDLKRLEAFQANLGDTNGEVPGWKPPTAWDKPTLPDVTTPLMTPEQLQGQAYDKYMAPPLKVNR